MYAQCKIEDHRDGKIYNPGDVVPDDLPGIEELEEYGSVGDEVPEEPKRNAAPVVDIDGTLYVKADEVNRKIADAKAKFSRDEISADEFEAVVADALDVNDVRSGDNGEGGDKR